eukprot:TRINITY_DN1765_c0_g1_i1.p1 TRINITY_DN1765_c0_g1~~TRINITY_DN1765_c0_g1_i1.p1  ORF type:complete len:371 (-),score=131.08 TRINITY_DN1765_c0_g1_i1:106-1218(-)
MLSQVISRGSFAARRGFSSKPPIPIIDIAPFLQTAELPRLEAKKQEMAQLMHEACRDVGFFGVCGHGINQAELDEVIDVSRQFFHSPQENKNKVLMTNKPFGFRGYQKLGQNVTQYQRDWHEAIDLYCTLPPSHPVVKRLQGEKEQRSRVMEEFVTTPNPWPTQPASFKPIFDRYIPTMVQLGTTIMRVMALSLKLPEHFFTQTKLVDESFWVLRIIGYPPLPQASTASNGELDVGMSCGPHTDYGCLTIINADKTPGALQVLNRRDEWITVDPIPDTFVMNIGDMFNIWTRGLYRANLHRVMNKNANYRVSLPFFLEPNFEAVVRPLPSPLLPRVPADATTAKKYEPVVYGDHLFSKVSSNFDWNEWKK